MIGIIINIVLFLLEMVINTLHLNLSLMEGQIHLHASRIILIEVRAPQHRPPRSLSLQLEPVRTAIQQEHLNQIFPPLQHCPPRKKVHYQ